MKISYARLLFNTVFFAASMTGMNWLLHIRKQAPLLGDSLWIEAGVWLLVGLFAAVVSWRAEGYIERKNERWRKNR